MILSELRAGAWKYACIACAVLGVAAVLAAAVFRGNAANASRRADAAIERATQSEAALRDAQHVIEVERKQADAANKVAAQYEQDKTNVQAENDRLRADLRTGAVKLREPWRCESPTVPATGASASEPDAAERSRQESAARVIGAADAADAQVKALQDFIRAERSNP